MLEIKDVKKLYSLDSGISSFSETFLPGQIYSLIGPNGVGKTTMCNLIAGLLTPDKGTILLNGNNVINRSAKADIGFALTEDAFYPNMKLCDLFAFLLQSKYGAIDNAQLTSLIEGYQLSQYINRKYFDCSEGMRKKFKIVLSLYGPTELIILDEPTNGIDTSALIRLKEDLIGMKKQEKTIIITSHVLDFVEKIADEHIFMRLLDSPVRHEGCNHSLEETYKELYL